MSNENYYRGGIHLFGTGGGGKTTLLHRMATGQFLDNAALTIGLKYNVLEVESNGFKLFLDIYDRGGQDQWRFLDSSYDRLGGKLTFAGFIVIDMAKPIEWQEEAVGMMERFRNNTNDEEKRMVVVGTKHDMLDASEEISYTSGLESIVKNDSKSVGPVITSAKTGKGIPELKSAIIHAFRDYFKV